MNVNDEAAAPIIHTNTNTNQSNSNEENKSSSSSIQRALHILNIANLKYFTELQKSELFSIKAEIKQKLQLLDDSNASYSASLAIAGDNWKAWTKWGDFCDSIFSAKNDYRWAMYAMISYLCSLHGGDELTRAYWPDNLMNPIHPNYPKNNHNNSMNSHSLFNHHARHNTHITDDVLQKHGDPEKDLQHSNYHHLVIPRILMLIQAAKLGPEDNNQNNQNENDKKEQETKQQSDNNKHIDQNGEHKIIPTRENSEFIRYLYDGVMKLPPHVFLGYIPQLITGLYRYETDACYLILNDHIRFIAPQYLFYYIYHYIKTHETTILNRHLHKFTQAIYNHQSIADNIKNSLRSVNDTQQRQKLQNEGMLYQQRVSQFKKRIEVARNLRCVLEKQHSYQQMIKIQHNLISNKESYKLQSIINEQRDLMPRLKKFGNDVNNQKNMKLLSFLNPLKTILNNILSSHPANGKDFASFIYDNTKIIFGTTRLFKRLVSQAANSILHGSLQLYSKQFDSDFRWILDIKTNAEQQYQLKLQQQQQQTNMGQQANRNMNPNDIRIYLNNIPMKQQQISVNKLFHVTFVWYKHITFRIGILERSLNKLKALYGSDLNFYEPAQEIFCPGFIGKTLFRRKPRIDNLPHSLNQNHHAQFQNAQNKNNLNEKNQNMNGHPNKNNGGSINDKFNRNLWSMDAPSIIRILPKLFLLPNSYKEFYILCNDGIVRSYRIHENIAKSSLRLIRDQQLVKFCNELFKSNSQTRKRFLCNHNQANIVPCDLSSIFYQFNSNEISFNKIVNTHCIQNNLDQIKSLSTYLKRLQEIHLKNGQNHPNNQNNQNRTDNKIKLFETMQKEYFPQTMFDDYIAKSLIGSSYKLHSTTAEFFQFKKTFAKSLAFHNLWLICWKTNNRSLENYFIRMDTGELICRGDFGTNLNIFNRNNINNHNNNGINNLFPLRITPNLNYLLQPNLLDAYFTLSLSIMASVMIQNTYTHTNQNNPNNQNNQNNQSHLINNNNQNNDNEQQPQTQNDDMKYLKHFMYIHFREAKLEITKRSVLNINHVNIQAEQQLMNNNNNNNTSNDNNNNTNNNNNPLYQLLDRQLLNLDFKWMNELNNYSRIIAEQIKTLSYPVFGEPPFSFRNYDPNNQQQNDNNDIDQDDVKYVEPMQRVTKMVNDAKSVKVICQMPPSWNPFF